MRILLFFNFFLHLEMTEAHVSNTTHLHIYRHATRLSTFRIHVYVCICIYVCTAQSHLHWLRTTDLQLLTSAGTPSSGCPGDSFTSVKFIALQVAVRGNDTANCQQSIKLFLSTS